MELNTNRIIKNGCLSQYDIRYETTLSIYYPEKYILERLLDTAVLSTVGSICIMLLITTENNFDSFSLEKQTNSVNVFFVSFYQLSG